MNAETVDILAHQGGWDEIALLAGPVLVIAVLGYLAHRGAAETDDDDATDAADAEDASNEESDGR